MESLFILHVSDGRNCCLKLLPTALREAYKSFIFLIYFWCIIHQGSKPKPNPKREKTNEEKTFKRRGKYFVGAQLVAVLLFLTLMGRGDDGEVELDDDDEGYDYSE